jgi:hypothetical protein
MLLLVHDMFRLTINHLQEHKFGRTYSNHNVQRNYPQHGHKLLTIVYTIVTTGNSIHYSNFLLKLQVNFTVHYMQVYLTLHEPA